MSIVRPSAIVTGAAGGLGRALALRLARDGWNLALCDIDLAGTAETLRLVEQQGGTGRVERLDVTQADQWQALRERLSRDWPQLDLLVNNAGVVASGAVGELPLDDWRWVLSVSLDGAIYGCHTMVPWLRANPGRAHILNVASIAGLVSMPITGAYNVAKAGVVALSETLAVELRRHRVGVTVLCPGFFSTDLLEHGRYHKPRELELARDMTDASRLTAEQVADAAVRAVARRQLYVVLPAQSRRWWRLKRFRPSFMIRKLADRYDRDLPPEQGGA